MVITVLMPPMLSLRYYLLREVIALPNFKHFDLPLLPYAVLKQLYIVSPSCLKWIVKISVENLL